MKQIRKRSIEAGLRPAEQLSLSAWADRHFFMGAETSATPGKWTTLPFQREIMDCMSSPEVTYVSFQKSARIGWTLMCAANIAFHIAHDPASMLYVLPTVDDSKAYSKETVTALFRDCPALRSVTAEDRDTPDGTLLHKQFSNGAVLSLIGANSGSGFRRISRKIITLDEVDAMPASAGNDGDPVKLASKRSEFFWDRKILAGSTPLIAGLSRIESLFLAGDQRRYHLPCPHCAHRAPLFFSEKAEAQSHFIRWDEGNPGGAHMICGKCGCVVEHSHKRAMIEAGAWVAAGEFSGHASFHINALYSYSPNASWGEIVTEFLEAKRGGRETLRTFVNTTLGETFAESGEAPDWERLYQRREGYDAGTVPEGVKFLTAGVDVQKDRWVYEVVGWSGREKESWSIDTGELFGDTSNAEQWSKLDELLGRTYLSAAGVAFAIRMLAVDSGYNTQQVYGWTRGHDRNRVVAVKGVSTAHALTSTATPVDVTIRGKKIARGARVFPVGSSIAKTELYGWLRLQPPLEASGHYPAGFCHFPSGYDPEYFKQLTAEHLVSTVSRRGYKVLEWHVIPGRENHRLDCRVYARAAAAILGVDRMRADPERVAEQAKVAPPVPVPTPVSHPAPVAPAATQITRPALSDSRFIGKRSGWLSKRR